MIGIWPSEEVNSIQLINFFDNCRSLKSIHLAGDDEVPIDDQLLAYFIGASQLEELDLDGAITYETLYKALAMTDQLQRFRNIHSLLLCGMDSNSIPLLVKVLKDVNSLTSLNITPREFDTNPFPHVSSLVNLEQLQICSLYTSLWTRSDFLTLSKLKNLKSFGIRPLAGHLTCLDMTDEDFISVFENFTELEELEFPLYCDLSIASLNALGACCPKLLTCQMIGRFDLDGWDSPKSHGTTIFPCLEFLQLSEIHFGSRQRTR